MIQFMSLPAPRRASPFDFASLSRKSRSLPSNDRGWLSNTENWFGVACELHRDWRNDVEGLATLFSNHIPDYRNLINSYSSVTARK